ncbi:MAG: SAM-dependent methyltransferase [Pseudomonadota bacterium]
MKIELTPIGHVRGGRTEILDDDWGTVQATIEMDAEQFTEEAIAGLDTFSHLVVIYHFHKVTLEKIETSARHPRGNMDWPKIGIFAQRGKNRPNRIGTTTCRILGLDGLSIKVQGLDAIDGTPVLDIKPYMRGFEPLGEVLEPEWASELMEGYW